MTKLKHFSGKHSLLLTTFLLSFPSSAVANPTVIADIESSGATVAKEPKTGKVTFIGSNSPNGIQNPSTFRSSVASTPPEKARNFLRAYAPLFGVDTPDTDLIAKKTLTLDGQPVVKYQQVYKGIKVFAGEINVNLDNTGNLLSMSGEAAPDLTLSTAPKVSAA